MLTFIIILFLCLAGYTGYRRGFLRELVYVFGYAMSFVIASMFYPIVSQILQVWIPYPVAELSQKMAIYTSTDLADVYYNGLGFMLIFFLGWLLTRLLGVSFYKLSAQTTQLGRILASLINVVISYVFVICVLTILSVVPIDGVQSTFESNTLASKMVTDTPIISNYLQDKWFQANY